MGRNRRLEDAVTLQELFDRTVKFAAERFAAHQHVDEFYMVQDMDGNVFPVLARQWWHPNRTITRERLRKVFKEFSVVRYCYAGEGYLIFVKSDDEDMEDAIEAGEMKIEDHPGRREIVSYLAEDGENVIAAHQYILRPEHGSPVLAPINVIANESLVETTGTLSGLLT